MHRGLSIFVAIGFAFVSGVAVAQEPVASPTASPALSPLPSQPLYPKCNSDPADASRRGCSLRERGWFASMAGREGELPFAPCSRAAFRGRRRASADAAGNAVAAGTLGTFSINFSSQPTNPTVQPKNPPGPTKLERESQFNMLALVLTELSRRYPTVSSTTIRSLAVDVLCHSLPERLTPSTVARVLEARLSAML